MIGIKPFLHTFNDSCLISLVVSIIFCHFLVYVRRKLYSSWEFPIGFIQTPIVLLVVIISSRLMVYLVGKLPLVRFIWVGEFGILVIYAFPSSSYFQ